MNLTLQNCRSHGTESPEKQGFGFRSHRTKGFMGMSALGPTNSHNESAPRRALCNPEHAGTEQMWQLGARRGGVPNDHGCGQHDNCHHFEAFPAPARNFWVPKVMPRRRRWPRQSFKTLRPAGPFRLRSHSKRLYLGTLCCMKGRPYQFERRSRQTGGMVLRLRVV